MPPNAPPSTSALRPSRRIDAVSRLGPDYLAYAESIAHAGSDPMQRLEVCRHFVRFGMIGETVSMLTTLMDVPSLRAEIGEVMDQLRAIRRLRAAAPVALPDMRTDDEAPDDRGYWVVPAQSDTTVIAFAGRAQRLAMSTYFMHGLLGRLNANMIYLFDWSDSYYFAGVSGLGNDTGQTVARLRALCAELGSRRVLCLGQSAGGHAALRYGVELQADGVMAFSPIILPVMGPRVRGRIATNSGVELSPEQADLRRLVAAVPHPPYIEIAYGDANRWDVASANYLGDLPGVVERPLVGVESHATLQETALAGTLMPMIETFITAVGPGSWPERA